MRVYTTFQPWQELDVDEAEFHYLKTSGLLVEEETPTPTTDPTPPQGSAE